MYCMRCEAQLLLLYLQLLQSAHLVFIVDVCTGLLAKCTPQLVTAHQGFIQPFVSGGEYETLRGDHRVAEGHVSRREAPSGGGV